jgi:ribosomal protein L29
MTARLTEDRVREIYKLLASNRLTHQQIASHFHISRVTVSYINNLDRRYRHLAPQGWKPMPAIPARGERNDFAKLTADEVREIYKLAWSGCYWLRELAERFDVSVSQISLLKHRKEWAWLLLDNNEGNEMSDKTPAELETEMAQLQKQLADMQAKLEAMSKPSAPTFKREPRAPIDYTAGASMDRETRRELAKAFPDSLVRDLRADAFKPNPVTGVSQAQLTPQRNDRVQIQRDSGWVEPNPLSAPPGVPIMDRLMDMQDAIDKADLQRRLAGAGAKKE